MRNHVLSSFPSKLSRLRDSTHNYCIFGENYNVENTNSLQANRNAGEKIFINLLYIILQIFVLASLISPQDTNRKNTTTADSDWQFLGLENEGITAIAINWVDPDVIYAGSGSDFSSGTVGGIFKSTDGGTTWDTLIQGVTVRDLDIHPTNSQIIYATLGLNALTQTGIIKTTDGGISWIKADYGIRMSWEEGPQVLEIDPKRPDTLYTGTSGPFGGWPYKSTNGGESWFRIDPDSLWIWMHTLCGDSIFVNGYPLGAGVTAIAVDPVNTNIIYLGTAFSGFLFKSSDGGKNFIATCLPQVGIVYDLEVNPLNTEKIYCGAWFYGFFTSTDSGFSWENMNTGLPDSSTIEKMELYNSQGNAEIFIIANWGDYGGIYQSINNSKWEKIGIGTGPVSTIKLFSEKLYAGYGGIYVKQIITDVNEKIPTPTSVNIYPNYPNPFNSNTNIDYEIDKEVNVSIEVFNVLGEKIKTLVNERKLKGKYITNWDGTDDKGRTVSSGFYVCVLRMDDKMQNIKMLYMK